MKDIVITTGDGRELKGLYQWDINQKICISGIETSPPPEIHFWACRLSKALVVPTQVHGDKVIADVPNILLQVAEPITIFIYKRTGEDGHRTSDAILCPVRARPQPEEYEYQDNIEYTSWVELTEEARELIDQIDEIMSSMSGIADQALTYATSAGDSASSANTAKLAAELAQGKAEDAQAAAELAQGKAEDAQEAAEAVLESIPESYDELVDDMDNFKRDLVLVQSTQPTSEDNRLWVVTSTGEEVSVPTDAEFHAAVDDLQDTVNGKAPAICQSVGPAAIASFNDGADNMPVKSLTVDIEPVQDLHGYDNPWPAGGGKNKCALPDDANLVSESNVDIYPTTSPVLATGNYVVSFDAVELSWQNSSAAIMDFYDEDNVNFAYPVPSRFKRVSDNVTMSSLTQPVTGRFYYAVTNHSVKHVIGFFQSNAMSQFSGTIKNVQLESGSTATAYAPYSNICPISGWTGAEVSRTGVNVWDEEWEVGRLNTNTGNDGADPNVIRSKNYIPIIDTATYYFHSPSATNVYALCYDVNKVYMGTVARRVSNNATSVVNSEFYVPNRTAYIRFYQTGGSTYNNDISINYPATDTEYHAYQGTTISVTFPNEAGTVYGGTLDVTNGVLTVDRAMVDLGTLDWGYVSGTSGVNYFLSNKITDAKKPSANAEAVNAICSMYKTIAAYSVYLGNVGVGIDTVQKVRIYTSAYDNATAFKTAMSGVQLVYELAESLEFDLTPSQLETLLGTNNVWSDTGDATVEYAADTNLNIGNRMSELVDDVQINGTSVVNNGVANIPVATTDDFGVVKLGGDDNGISAVNGKMFIVRANDTVVKAGTNNYRPIVPNYQHKSVFYGLAKAAGADEKNSSLALGQYTENAKSAIQSMLGVTDSINNASSMLATVETTTTASKAYAIGDLLIYNRLLYKVTSAITLGSTIIPDGNVEQTTVEQELSVANNDVTDVQVNGTSVVSNGVANVPMAGMNTFGVVKVNGRGLLMDNSNCIAIAGADESIIKSAGSSYQPVVPSRQHASAFYGLAKAAGDTTQAQSSNAVGTYTDEAKAAIQTMLGLDLQTIASAVEIPLVETVSGTTPAITGEPNVRYKCGEVSTITITPPASGSIDVIFDSGSTAAVLTVPNTVRWPEWFDATALETDTTYEILITDGVYGSVMSWAI